MIDDDDARDLDETRRLAIACKLALLTYQRVSVELVASLVHAIAYHSNIARPSWAERFGVCILNGTAEDDLTLAALDWVIARTLV